MRLPSRQIKTARRIRHLQPGHLWKDQHASLVSFSADAYLNEMGITTPLQPTDNTSNGRVVDDLVPGEEDDGADVEIFARFMRATGVPPRDTAVAATPNAQAGETIFRQIDCDTCHVRQMTTLPPGPVINRGAFTVPATLGNKVIRPFSDSLLHNVGTGDGIVRNGGQSTRNKLRTAPLWGMRSRDRLMHDGESLTRNAVSTSASVTHHRRSTSTSCTCLVQHLASYARGRRSRGVPISARP